MKEKIIIFDTTLRDGEQSPGASLNMLEKVEIARQLAKMKVDVIEAGFPVSSPAQFEAVQQIAGSVDAIIAGLARAVEKDIKAAHDALKEADRFRIHTFIGTSDIHIEEKFRAARYGQTLADKRATILKMARDAVAYARTFTDDVEFSPEDAGRTDIEYLCEVVAAAIAAGATTINIPDTTGYTMPGEFGAKIAELKRRVPNIDEAVISVHCHNDLGLGVANSLSAIRNGARQVECTVNGIGERAGNASLEEIVMALKVRDDYWEHYTDIDIGELVNASKMVSAFTGIIVQPNKAIVGDNAFAHEAGIHQDGVIKNRRTYEIISPESVGVHQSRLVLGRHSGRHGLKARLQELGYHPSEDDLQLAYDKFVELADRKKEVHDDDLRTLMGDEIYTHRRYYEMESLKVSVDTAAPKATAVATVTVKVGDGETVTGSSEGDGPVDACFLAIDQALGTKANLLSYQVRSVTSGRDAQGEVLVRVRWDDQMFMGRGVSTDIIEASAKAYIHGLNEVRTYAAEMEKGLTQPTTEEYRGTV